jgi:hypothetical protein
VSDEPAALADVGFGGYCGLTPDVAPFVLTHVKLDRRKERYKYRMQLWDLFLECMHRRIRI